MDNMICNKYILLINLYKSVLNHEELPENERIDIYNIIKNSFITLELHFQNQTYYNYVKLKESEINSLK
jgi:hypothetical protein